MSDTINVFDRIDITVAGERLTARPTDFNYDEKGEPVAAVRYETTCPKCGNLIDFTADHVWHQDDQDHVACANCGAGRAKPVAAPVAQAPEPPVSEPAPVPPAPVPAVSVPPAPVPAVSEVKSIPKPKPESKPKKQAAVSKSPEPRLVSDTPVKQAEPTITIKPTGQIVEEPHALNTGVRVPDRGCPFIDPIAEGDFTTALMIYCEACSAAGGADKPVYHEAPACEKEQKQPAPNDDQILKDIDLPGQH